METGDKRQKTGDEIQKTVDSGQDSGVVRTGPPQLNRDLGYFAERQAIKGEKSWGVLPSGRPLKVR